MQKFKNSFDVLSISNFHRDGETTPEIGFCTWDLMRQELSVNVTYKKVLEKPTKKQQHSLSVLACDLEF